MEKKTSINVNFTNITVEEAKALIKKLTEEVEKVEGNQETQESTGEPLTYKAIMSRLYNENPRTYYPSAKNVGGLRADCVLDINMKATERAKGIHLDWDNCMTKEQAWRIQAFNKLQNIAVYLNDVEWKPNFELNQNGYRGKAFCIVRIEGQYKAFQVSNYCALVYFQTEEKAEQAIQLMGEDLLNDLFNVKWQ